MAHPDPLAVACEYADRARGSFIRRSVRSAALLLSAALNRIALPAAVDARVRRVVERHTRIARVHHDTSARSVRKSNALLVTHDLSASGAPKVVFEIAQILLDSDISVLVLSPVDGPFREQFVAIGAVVVIDAGALEPKASVVAAMAIASDFAICNTAVTFEVVRGLAAKIPTFWYLHEVSLIRDLLQRDSALSISLGLPFAIWAGSELTAALVRPHRNDVEVFPYGVTPLGTRVVELIARDRARINVFASIEKRKGQDLAVAAIKRLSLAERAKVDLRLYGRILEADFHARLVEAVAHVPEVTICGDLDSDAYRTAMLESDAVLIPSRDDTLPLVSIDALGSSRLLMCTATTGTAAYLEHGANGFIAGSADASSIAVMLSAALARRDAWHTIAAAGHEVFLRAFSRTVFADRLRAEIARATSATLVEA